MTNTTLLRSIIKESGIKYVCIAEKLGISRYALSLKIDNKNEFKAGEIKKLCELLGIDSAEQMESIFFTK